MNSLKGGVEPRFGREFFATEPPREVWEIPFREGLRSALGLPPVEWSGAEPVPGESRMMENYRQETYRLCREGEDLFPLVILTPESRREGDPVILAFSGHGPGVAAMTGDYEPEECHHNFGRTLARAGFTVVMPEIIGFGLSRLEKDRTSPGETSCRTLASELLTLGFTLTGLRLRQGLALLDLIGRRYGKVPLGCFGFSGGGLLGYMLAALDTRIDALGLTGYCSTFPASILTVTHCLDNYVPGLYRLCDQPEIARLVAPRPLFVEARREDPVFPFPGAEEAQERMGAAYRGKGGRDSFVFHPMEGGHEIHGLKMIEWFREVLK